MLKNPLKPIETLSTSTYGMNYTHLNTLLEHRINGAERWKLMLTTVTYN